MKNEISCPDIKCPKCSSTQITSNKKGFSGGKAIGGAILTGGVGLLFGLHGSNDVKITCLACGHQFKPGEDLESVQNKKEIQKQKLAEAKIKNDKIMKSLPFKILKWTILSFVAFILLLILLVAIN